MENLVAPMIEDLRAFSALLLDRGLAPGASARGVTRVGARPAAATFAVTLAQIDELAGLLEGLLAELDGDQLELVVAATPVRAQAPRRPSAWQRAPQGWFPRHWERFEPVSSPHSQQLAYVAFVLERLALTFDGLRQRLVRHLGEARIARAGTSTFAAADLQQLARMERNLDRADAVLGRTRRELQRAAGGQVRPSDRMPHPFPRSLAWSRFRRLAEDVLAPQRRLPSAIGDLLRADAAAPDLPFLYQRWVGLQLVRELEGIGFALQGDPVGALFLGGCIAMRRATTEIRVWCEPRLSQQDHPSGLESTRAEATPDYVLVTPGHGGDDAFVLDATLSSDATTIDRKARYRQRIAFREMRFAAGVPGRRRPLRAWAASPLQNVPHNQLLRPDGSAGIVPVCPEPREPRPLRAWLADIVAHAEAWQGLRDRREHDGDGARQPVASEERPPTR